MNIPARTIDPNQTVPRPPRQLPVRTRTLAYTSRKRRIIRREKIGPAFWTVASLLSIGVNLILLALLLSLGGQLFTLKRLVNDQLIAGLYDNFVLMDQAAIQTTIPIHTTVPARFDVPFETDTEVTLTQDTLINNAIVNINGGVLQVNQAPTTILLPAGTRLPIHLNITVPIDQQIPVNLTVEVDIPLSQTELHEPFTGLQNVVKPYRELLAGTPDSWAGLFCGHDNMGWCARLLEGK